MIEVDEWILIPIGTRIGYTQNVRRPGGPTYIFSKHMASSTNNHTFRNKIFWV
jgi:hypothetical protein